jgi:hypothetical protein
LAPQLFHLAKRFVGSLMATDPPPADDAWARRHLLPGEQQLWASMPAADRSHAVGVSQRVARALGAAATRPVLAAALLHDVGKTEAALGTFGRAVATVHAALAGPRRAGSWRSASGWRGRVGRYVAHPELGAVLLRAAGSDPLTVAWAAEHQGQDRSGVVPAEVAAALAAADDD